VSALLPAGLRRFASSESIYAILRHQSLPHLYNYNYHGKVGGRGAYICLSTPSALIPVCVTNRFPPIANLPSSLCPSSCDSRRTTTTALSPSSSSSSTPRGLEARNSTPPPRCLREARRRRIAAVEGASSSSLSSAVAVGDWGGSAEDVAPSVVVGGIAVVGGEVARWR
jgi:hypothetical protein